MPYYHVAIVYMNGAAVCHSGLIEAHAQAMFQAARLHPEVNYCQLSMFRGAEWRRLDHHVTMYREGE